VQVDVVDREHIGRELVDCWSAKNAMGRRNWPNFAAAPGNGKTTALSGICIALNTSVPDTWYAKLRKDLRESDLSGLENACGVFATFNNESVVVPEEHNRLPDAMARRLLAGYNYPYCGKWKDAKLKYDEQLTIEAAVSFLCEKAHKDGRTALVICVDEVAQIPVARSEEASMIMSRLCQQMDAQLKVPVYVVSSSLDTVFGLHQTTSSLRAISWIFLGPLRSDYLMKKFAAVLKPVLPNESDGKIRTACAFLAALTGGHPRLFITILNTFRNWHPLPHDPLHVESLMTRAQDAATATSDLTSPELAAAVIARLPLSWKARLPLSRINSSDQVALTVDEMLKAGYIFNAVQSRSKDLVPHVPPFLLLRFMQSEPELVPRLTGFLRRLIPPLSGAWGKFETFHAAWECLVRNSLFYLHTRFAQVPLAQNDTLPHLPTMTMSWLYGVSDECVPERVRRVTFLCNRYRSVMELFRSGTNCPPLAKKLDASAVLDSVLLMKWDDQPGFDSVVIEQDTEGKLWCIAIQNKFTEVMQGNVIPETKLPASAVKVSTCHEELFGPGKCTYSLREARVECAGYLRKQLQWPRKISARSFAKCCPKSDLCWW
jgi:hypothetical protein